MNKIAGHFGSHGDTAAYYSYKFIYYLVNRTSNETAKKTALVISDMHGQSTFVRARKDSESFFLLM